MSFTQLMMDLGALPSLAGGMLIGLAAATLLLFNGNILGASGIIASTTVSPLQSLQDPSQHWKHVFMASFLLTANVFYAPTFVADATVVQPLSWAGFCLAGFLVGFGTQLGSGCTSGHGICGLARLSKRSFVAVMTFMGIAAATTALMSSSSPLISDYTGFLRTDAPLPGHLMTNFSSLVSLLLLTSAMLAPWFHANKHTKSDFAKLGPAAIAGLLLAHGLFLSGMVKSSKVKGFFNVNNWDPALAFVMGGGLLISWISYQLVQDHRSTQCFTALSHPIALEPGTTFSVPPKSQPIDRNLIMGAAIFGLGWGLAGICPGPGLFLAGAGVPQVVLWWLPSFFVGSYQGKQFAKISGQTKKSPEVAACSVVRD